MFGCVLSQLKPSELYILSCENSLGFRPRTLFTAENVELIGLYSIQTVPLSSTVNRLKEDSLFYKISSFLTALIKQDTQDTSPGTRGISTQFVFLWP